jgi:hypothetical protein
VIGAPKRPKWDPLADAPYGSPEVAITEFCLRAWGGGTVPPAVMQWVAHCLSEIKDNTNHSGRPAFGLRRRRGRQADLDFRLIVALHVACARRYGWKKRAALDLAAKRFHRSVDTLEGICKEFAPQLKEFGLEDLEGLLRIKLIELPPRPGVGGKK